MAVSFAELCSFPGPVGTLTDENPSGAGVGLSADTWAHLGKPTIRTKPDGRTWVLKAITYTEITYGSKKQQDGLVKSAFNVDVLLQGVNGDKTASIPIRFRIYPSELAYEAKLVSQGSYFELSKAGNNWLVKQTPPFSFQNLSLGTDASDGAPIIFDALNFLHTFVPIDEPEFQLASAPILFQEMEVRVDQLAKALALEGNRTCIFVFDNGQTTDEANEKWLSRRKMEVLYHSRNMPCSSEVAFFGCLQRNGFLVLYPEDIDGDDAVALLAWHMAGVVVSRDKDMLRYTGLSHKKIFRGFGIDSETGKIVLEPQRAKLDDRERRDMFDLMHHLPENTTRGSLQAEWGMNAPTICERALKGSSKRGNADACTAECGNLNSAVIPLLEVVYHACDVQRVELKMPEAVYDEDTFEPIDAVLATYSVEASDEMAEHLKTPESTYQWMVNNVKMPSSGADALLSRAHATCMLSAEIFDAYDWQLHKKTKYADTQYSPDRVYKVYTKLAKMDVHLAPTLSHGASTIDTSWCAAYKCAGVTHYHTGITRCHAPKGSEGFIFAHQAKRAAEIGKTPLCRDCVNFLRRV